MRPSQVSSVLRQIATKITNSKNPRRDLVSKDLEFVLSKLAASKPEMKVFSDGTKEWKLNGKLHREDGPAIEWPDGSTAWWLNGKHHREDGPAEEFSDGTKYWYLNNKQLTKRQLISDTMKRTYPEIYESYLAYQVMTS